MFTELKKYKNNGHFFFKRGQTLSEECNAPDKPGVYYIIQLCKGNIQFVYVGASGTMNQNGPYKNKLLNDSINNKQNGVNRQNFFEEIMEQKNIDALDIYWFVTVDEKHQHLPNYLEELLLQKHFEIYGCLPEWNKEF